MTTRHEPRGLQAMKAAASVTAVGRVRCPGYSADGGFMPCDGTPGTPWTPVWCPECDERRRTRITKQFEAMS